MIPTMLGLDFTKPVLGMAMLQDGISCDILPEVVAL